MKKEINREPTVAEYAERRIHSLDVEIEKLQDQRKYYNYLLNKYLCSQMLYAEYVANNADPYQNKPL